MKHQLLLAGMRCYYGLARKLISTIEMMMLRSMTPDGQASGLSLRAWSNEGGLRSVYNKICSELRIS